MCQRATAASATGHVLPLTGHGAEVAAVMSVLRCPGLDPHVPGHRRGGQEMHRPLRGPSSCLAGRAPHLLQRLLPPATGPLGTSGRAQGLCLPRFSSGTSHSSSQMCLCGEVGRGYPKHELSHCLRSQHRTLHRSASAAGPCLRRTRFSGPGVSGWSRVTRGVCCQGRAVALELWGARRAEAGLGGRWHQPQGLARGLPESRWSAGGGNRNLRKAA